jgi:hypothetical protein
MGGGLTYGLKNEKGLEKAKFRASLGTTFSQGISIFPREISLFSLGKIEIPWKNGVPKLAFIGRKL